MRYKSRSINKSIYDKLSDLGLLGMIFFVISYFLFIILAIIHNNFENTSVALIKILAYCLAVSVITAVPSIILYIICKIIIHFSQIIPRAYRYDTLSNKILKGPNKIKLSSYIVKGDFYCIIDDAILNSNPFNKDATIKFYKDINEQINNRFIYIIPSVDMDYLQYNYHYTCKILGEVLRDEQNNIIFDNAQELNSCMEGYFN